MSDEGKMHIVTWVNHNPWEPGDPEPKPDQTLVQVTMPAAHWESVLTSMDWAYPDLDDKTPGGERTRRISEHCFAAQRTIRAAIADQETQA